MLLEAAMKNSFTTRDLAYIAMGVALIAVCSWISVPMTIPFTMQTFAVCLVTALFGLRRGMWTVLCYILLGAVGAPVFSGFKGGIGALLGTTGGYIVGFLFTALIVGLAVEKFGRSLPVLIVSMVLGILVCYAFGTAWFMVVYARKTGPIGLGTALGWCVFPYLLPDAVKIALASVLTLRLYPLLQREVKAA
jgi:biotin transport system substrate-specific component